MSQPGFNIEQRMSGPPLGAPMGPPPSGQMQPPPQSGANPFGLRQRGRSPYSKQQQNAFMMPPGHQGMRPQMPGTNNFPAQPDSIMPMPFGGMTYRGQSEPQSGSLSWPSSPGDPFPMNKSPASLPPTLQPQQQAPFNLFNPGPQVNGAFAPHEANPAQPSSSIDSMSSVFSRLALDSPGVSSGVPKPIGILRGDLQGDDPGYIDESDEVSTDDESDDDDSASDEESSDDAVDVRENQGFGQEKTLLSQTVPAVANPAVDSGYTFGQSQGQTSQQNLIADSFAQGNTDSSPGGFKATSHFQASQVPAGSMHPNDDNQMKESTLSSVPSSKFHANNDILNSFENNGPINLFEGPSAVPSTLSFNDRQVLVNQPHHDQPQFERTDSHSSASSLTSRSLGGPEPHPSAFKPVLSTRKSNSDMAVSDAKMYQPRLVNQFEAEQSREESGHSVHANQNLFEPSTTGDEIKMINSSQEASVMAARYQHPEPINMDSFDNLETSQLHMSSENHHIRKDYPHTHGFGLSLALQKNGDGEKVLSPRQSQQKLTAKTELTSENQLQDKVTNSSTSSSDFSSESSSKSVLENAKYLGMKGQAQLSYPQKSESQIQSSIIGAEFDPQDQSSPAHQRYAGQNVNEQATVQKPLNSFEQASSAHYSNFQGVPRQEPQRSQQTSNTSGAQLQDQGNLPMNPRSFTDGCQQEVVSGQNLVNNGNPQTMPQFIHQTHNTNQFNVSDATPEFVAHSSKDHISGDQMPSEKKERNFISKKSPGLPMPENNFGITLRDPQNSYEQSISELAYSTKNSRGVDHFSVEATSTQALKDSVRQMPQQPYSNEPQQPYSNEPKQPYSNEPKQPYSNEPQQPYSNEPKQPYSNEPKQPYSNEPKQPYSNEPKQPYSNEPKPPSSGHSSMSDGSLKDRYLSQSGNLPTAQVHDPSLSSNRHQSYDQQPQPLQLSRSRQDGMQKEENANPFAQQDSSSQQQSHKLQQFEQPNIQDSLFHQNYGKQPAQPQTDQQMLFAQQSSYQDQRQQSLDRVEQLPTSQQSLNSQPGQEQALYGQPILPKREQENKQPQSKQPVLQQQQPGHQLNSNEHQNQSKLQEQIHQSPQQHENLSQFQHQQQPNSSQASQHQNLEHRHNFPQQHSQQALLEGQQGLAPQQQDSSQQNQPQISQQQSNKQQHSLTQQELPFNSHKEQNLPQPFPQQQGNQQQLTQQQQNPQQSAQQQQNPQQFAQQQQNQQRLPQQQQTPHQFVQQQQNQQQSAQQQQTPHQSAQQQQNPQQSAQQQQNPQQFAQQQQNPQRFPQQQQTPQQIPQQLQNPKQSVQQQQNPQRFPQQQQTPQQTPHQQQTLQQFAQQQQNQQQFAQQQQNQQHFSQEQQNPLQFTQQQQLQQQYAQQQHNLHQFPQQQQQYQQQFPQQQQNQQEPQNQEITFEQQQQQANQQGQQQHFPQGYGQQPPQGDANASYQHPHYGGMSPSVTAQQMQNYGDPRYMQGWNPNAPSYGQNYNDYYNWYYNMYNNWASYGYGYGQQQYPGQYPGATPWDVRSHHSSRSSYVSSRNPSEIDVDSRPSSVLEKRPVDEDFEIQSLQISKKEISTFEKASPVEMERLTPLHFYKPHITARFSYFGCCVVVDPNDPNENQTASVLCVPNKNLYTTSELQEFPGPLIRGETSKKSILMFAKIKSKHWLAKTDVKRELCDSMSLLWDFMAMLIKHNGIIDGPDVAELLMQHKPATDVGHKMGNLPGLHAADDVNKMPKAVAEEQYRDYLLQGSKKEALDFAVNHDLWGHALILSYKIDPKLHHAVMSRLISSLNDEDSLVSLYGHLSGRGLPSQACHAVRSGNADWREHLAMLIANPTKNSERDKKNIIVIGDALAEQGNIGAAHLCYLLAGVKLSMPDESGSKICLLGVDHKKENSSRVDLWAKNEFIQLTEIYEFALRQSKHSFIPAFQRMKFIYLNRLFEVGMLAEAFGYCESVAEAVLAEPRSYDCDFVVLFSNVCQRLFYLSMESPEDPEPEWYTRIWKLVELKESNVELSEEWSKSSEPSATSSSHQTPEHNSNATPSQEFQQEYSNETVSSSDVQPGYYPQQNQGVSHEVEGNIAVDNAQSAEPQKILQAVNQTNEYDAHQDENHGQWNPNEAAIPQQNESGYMQYEPPTQADYTDGQMQHPDQYQDQQPDWNQDQQGYGQQGYDQQMYNQQQQMYNPEATYPQYPEQSTQDFEFQGHYQENVNEGVQEAANLASPHPYEQQPDGDGEDQEDIYDLFGRKKIKTDAGNQKNEDAVDKKVDTHPKKETSKPDSGGVQSKGLFSTIVSKIFPGRSKEAFLPDDKDKSIYWDDAKGKFVNKDEADKPYTPPPPPPTDTQFASSFKPPTTNENFASLPTPASFPSPVLDRKLNASESNLPAPDTGEQRISPAPSKFSRTAHGIGKRGHRYVNSFSGIHKKDATDAPPAASLFNPLGAPQTAPMNFFVPQVPSSTNDHAESSGNAEPRASEVAQRPQQQPPQPQQKPHSQQPQQPAFFNPTNMQQTNKNHSRFQR